MNTTSENNTNNPEPTPQDRTLENVVTAIDRGQKLLAIVGNFANAALEKLDVLRISELANPDTLTVMDLYGQSVETVKRRLEGRQIRIVGKPIVVNDRKAYSLGNLGATISKLSSGSRVELLIDRDRVIGIRVLGEQKQ